MKITKKQLKEMVNEEIGTGAYGDWQANAGSELGELQSKIEELLELYTGLYKVNREKVNKAKGVSPTFQLEGEGKLLRSIIKNLKKLLV